MLQIEKIYSGCQVKDISSRDILSLKLDSTQDLDSTATDSEQNINYNLQTQPNKTRQAYKQEKLSLIIYILLQNDISVNRTPKY